MSLPVLPAKGSGIRSSRMNRWRTAALALVHVLMIGHLVHWYFTGTTLSPVEPSEIMYTLNDGHLNAGAIFFLSAILLTMVFGRFVCGWACHFIAYQDICYWALKKIGIKAKPLRSRLLLLAPLALALYMFVWPTAFRLWKGIPWPGLSNHLMKTAFWETFPGPFVGVISAVVCGFVIIYFLGAKGFCTYACPYGGFFAIADRVAPGRILVTDACAQCGHCTAACTSNVRVHDEVKLYGMVIDPGCMKCLDCVSVCPNDALHFGFALPPIGGATRPSPVQAGSQKTRRGPRLEFALWEEALMVVIGVGTLLSVRGLYGELPLLLAMAVAGIMAYVVMKLMNLAYRANVRLQNWQLRRGGRITRAGIIFAMTTFALLGLTAHSAALQVQTLRGHAAVSKLRLSDDIWYADYDWWEHADDEKRSLLSAAIERYEWVDRWGLTITPTALDALVRLYTARNDLDAAEAAVRRRLAGLPNDANLLRGLASVYRKGDRIDEALTAYRDALRVNPQHLASRSGLIATLVSAGRHDAAIEAYQEAIRADDDDATWRMALARLLTQLGRLDESAEVLTDMLVAHPDSVEGHVLAGRTALQRGDAPLALDHLRRAITLDENASEAHYHLGYCLLMTNQIDAAIVALERSITLRPAFAEAHYNLGVATFMAGRPSEAVPHVREAIRLSPTDPDAHGFLAVVLRQLGDMKGAAEAEREALRLQEIRRREGGDDTP